jgi:modification methylase
VPFTAVIERGFIAPGARLRDGKRRHEALVRADGTLSLQGIVGSIHKIGALAQGLPACNGWAYWHAENAGALVSIDEYRSAIRREFGKDL